MRTPKKLQRAISSIDSVRDVHDMHIWSLCSNYLALSTHVSVAEDASKSSHQLRQEINDKLQTQFGIFHTTIQIEQPVVPTRVCCCVTRPTTDATSLGYSSILSLNRPFHSNRIFVGVGSPNPYCPDKSGCVTGGATPPPDKSGCKHLRFRFAFCTFFLHEPLYFYHLIRSRQI